MSSCSIYLNKAEEAWLKEHGGRVLFKQWLQQAMQEPDVREVPKSPALTLVCQKCGGRIHEGRCLFCGRRLWE